MIPLPGSARGSRAGDGVLAIANFSIKMLCVAGYAECVSARARALPRMSAPRAHYPFGNQNDRDDRNAPWGEEGDCYADHAQAPHELRPRFAPMCVAVWRAVRSRATRYCPGCKPESRYRPARWLHQFVCQCGPGVARSHSRDCLTTRTIGRRRGCPATCRTRAGNISALPKAFRK
jgi:hypothetical protein